MYGKYSLINLIKECNNNYYLINSYLKGDIIEAYDSKKIIGLTVIEFLILLFISLIIWFYALMYLINNWKKIPGWSKFLGVTGLITGIGGPIMTIIVVYIGVNTR
jgi:hypothetical protein